jgi:uncharacterized membrane protein YvlD (DUF360 family)
MGRRIVVVATTNGLSLWLLAAWLGGFDIDTLAHALLAGTVVGVVNALVWPAIAMIVVPLSVLTLGAGSVVLNAALTGLVLENLPGVTLEGLWTAVWVTLGLTVVTTLVSAVLVIDDDAWFDERMARRARRSRRAVKPTDVPGFVFVQVDGLSETTMRFALTSGDLPTLRRWVQQGSHEIHSWETEWSSQTGVSQCGLLHGSVADMPAFRWVERETGRVVVSNIPASARKIELAHSDGNGLLAHDGSSYGNLFSGDARRGALTMSGAGKVKEGRIGSGYTRYFARPDQAARTLVSAVLEIVRERRAAGDQRRRGVAPRVDRNLSYAFLRAFTTVVSRDVCVSGVLHDIADGRSAVYVDLIGYDEVSHHSGPSRVDTMAVLRDIDRQIARFERAVSLAPRPYRIVVLSDHGQTQGGTFEDRYGETLPALVDRLTGEATQVDRDSDAGRTESSAWLRSARGHDGGVRHEPERSDRPVVLASGNLGLVYLPNSLERLGLEEIERRHPALIAGLRDHPGIGFTLVARDGCGSVVLGHKGSVNLVDGSIEGDDPLVPFGDGALEKIRRVDAYTNVADLMVNSFYDPELDEVAAFEHQVGSHGGLGGPQGHPFLLVPADLPVPPGPIDGPVAVHRMFKTWMASAAGE